MISALFLLSFAQGPQLSGSPAIVPIDSGKLADVISYRGSRFGAYFLSEDGKTLFHGSGGWRRISLTDFATSGFEKLFFSQAASGKLLTITTSQFAHLSSKNQAGFRTLGFDSERVLLSPERGKLVHAGANEKGLYVSVFNLDKRGQTPNSVQFAPVPKMKNRHFTTIVGSLANQKGEISIWVMLAVWPDPKTQKQRAGSLALEYRVSGKNFEKVTLHKRIKINPYMTEQISVRSGLQIGAAEGKFYFQKIGSMKVNTIPTPIIYGRLIEFGGKVYWQADQKYTGRADDPYTIGLWEFTGSSWRNIGGYRIVATSGGGKWMLVELGYSGKFWLYRFP
ncbi:MAG: hypothetical protein U0R49_12640 [Fimbriimonadales bacterium]